MLGIILGTYLMIVLDATIVITALPKIRTAFALSATGLSWVQNAYTLTFGGLLLLGARAGDILGRRSVFVAGIGLFTVASLLGGLAPSATWLLAARAVQGVVPPSRLPPRSPCCKPVSGRVPSRPVRSPPTARSPVAGAASASSLEAC